MAPGLKDLFVFVGSSDTAILGSMTTHTPLSAQLSSSWTWAPSDPSTDDPFFRVRGSGSKLFPSGWRQW